MPTKAKQGGYMTSIKQPKQKCKVDNCNGEPQIMSDGSTQYIKGYCGVHYKEKVISGIWSGQKLIDIYKDSKRFDEYDEPYCVGDDNKCKKIAEVKRHRADGSPAFRQLCNKHRRPHRDKKQQGNKNSVHYSPLNKCSWCDNKAIHRHRIEPHKGYYTYNILTLCIKCHSIAHQGYK